MRRFSTSRRFMFFAIPNSSVDNAPATNAQLNPEPDHGPCPICHEPVGIATVEGITERWCVLPCGHAFGARCLKRWLSSPRPATCPVCREFMWHSCHHPVLPIPHHTGEIAGTGDEKADSSGRRRRWHWPGRDLNEPCEFCAAQSPGRWIWRMLYHIVHRLIFRASTLRSQSAPTAFASERRADQHREAFRMWWALQEPRDENRARSRTVPPGSSAPSTAGSS